MSMKDAIFGTSAPTSHGGATYRDSIQAWLPVKNIIGGVVITKDNRFIKILEVLPVNFYLKSPSDQQNIITSYAAYLKIAPDRERGWECKEARFPQRCVSQTHRTACPRP